MTTLRTRLLALRADLLDRLSEAETLEPSWLGTLAGIAAALAAVDAEPAAVEIADRAVVALMMVRHCGSRSTRRIIKPLPSSCCQGALLRWPLNCSPRRCRGCGDADQSPPPAFAVIGSRRTRTRRNSPMGGRSATPI